ncbi:MULTISPECIES: M23 family metallopeptidase [unclassified Streptomyces]|uniref:M23 family metallopeptidase n=1 Tax=unclassified Streptomyces TaxID=2593676 RepID=UPI00381D035B
MSRAPAPDGAPRPRPSCPRTAVRVRGVASAAGPPLLAAGVLAASALPPPAASLVPVLLFTGAALLVTGAALAAVPTASGRAARPVRPPVEGRWTVLNSPADRVPSHGTHAWGQTYAVDLVHDPADGGRPAFGAGRAFRPPADFPAYGRPLVAPDDAVVVTVRDGVRDHRSRSTWAALLLMAAEAPFREAGGARRVLGNHVVLDLGDGVYAVLAHLRRGSAVVRPGQRVRRGELLARCGNSGNSGEPHLHFQLMDRPAPRFAAGVPFVFAGGGDLPGSGGAVDV